MDIETAENRKRSNLLGYATFFSIWQIGHIANFHFESANNGLTAIVMGAFVLVGVAGYMYFTWGFVRTNRLMKQNPELCINLNDERARLLRLRAMSYGFFACIGLMALFLAGSTLASAVFNLDVAVISGAFVAHVTLVVGIVCFWLALLILDEE